MFLICFKCSGTVYVFRIYDFYFSFFCLSVFLFGARKLLLLSFAFLLLLLLLLRFSFPRRMDQANLVPPSPRITYFFENCLCVDIF